MNKFIVMIGLFLFIAFISCNKSEDLDNKKIKSTSILAEELKSLIKIKKLHIIDVRSEDEYNGSIGHIEGSKLIPLQKIANAIDELKNIENEVYVVCLSGKRSAVAAKILRDNGVDALNLKGGMLAWNRLN